MENRSQNLIEPVYEQTEPNETIYLGRHSIEVAARSEVTKYDCEVTEVFAPKGGLRFEAIPLPSSSDPHSFNAFDRLVRSFTNDGDEELTLNNRGIKFSVLAVDTNEHGGPTFLPKRSPVVVSAPTGNIKYVVGHLFNFPTFISTDDYLLEEGNRVLRRGRVVLQDDTWRITLAALKETPDYIAALKKRGGHIITHMARIERCDGSDFSSASFGEIQNCVRHFLAFATGRWTGMAFCVGFSASGDTVFEEWGTGAATPNERNEGLSWFDSHHGNVLSEVFPGFSTLWRQELWQRTLRECIYWYVAANERGTGIGIDTGLILTQTAFEQLSWNYCVAAKKLVSKSAFAPRGGLFASDKLRLVISSLGLPAEIPFALVALTKRAKSASWEDSPRAITEIRNSIIHPDAKLVPTHDEYIEAWKLSLWLLELAVLRLCRHKGKYGNRLAERWGGEVEQVPWMIPAL
jgi:hypothetical protein